MDEKNPDAVHAVESLSKLGYVVPKSERPHFTRLTKILPPNAEPYCAWLLANSEPTAGQNNLVQLLDSPNAEVRGNAAYALRYLAKTLTPNVVAKLGQAAAAEPSSTGRIYLVSAAYVTAPNNEEAAKFHDLLTPYLTTGTTTEKLEALNALAVRGRDDDLSAIAKLLKAEDADVRVSAANAASRIDRRRALPFEVIDWVVIAIYAGLMISVGVYYERQTKTTDDYLLGGRKMKSWAVGLSYYATLFSTISYLAYPGEIIKHGPLILGSLLSYPLIFIVVSRFMIPFIMRLRVTSAYEILEKRFGLSVRMLGSIFFLILRLTWMSVIIYATSSAILIPLLRLNESATPWVCLAMGTLTVIYTSLGGLKAVVWTDVAQTFILLFGALLTIVTINYRLGGIGGWWPESWDPNWEVPTWGLDPTKRVTLMAAMISGFVWYVCTAGSDQMAIQRYLATRDVRSARRMFGISLCCDVFVAGTLAMLGLALYAYFRVHPEMLPDGELLSTGADRLLPQYIVKGLPPGISGLVVAGLLAAAMSSLSSGLSSSCSVITVDWVDRFRRVKLQDAEHLKLARRVSWILGGVIVLLSVFAGAVPGNLMEASGRLVNMLTAPLFVLFFMAMFVPWATTFGTCAAGLASVISAVAIAQFSVMGLSFLWISPVSLLIGIGVGCLASLIPIGGPRPMLETEQLPLSD